MHTRFDHTQSAHWLVWSGGLAGILVTGGFWLSGGHTASLAVAGVILLLLMLFAWLRVSVDETHLRLRFGVGLIRLRFRLSDIAACRPVRNKWWYGWGIRLTPDGWLFCVNGLDAVEIKMKNGNQYRIGTDRPDDLTRCILEARLD
ncbi:MAG: hypothetical protein KKA42_02445 [candidate division Zixibacteria bacterium]|nr:hypothetical protein [candidate division Zixibacteria bacterium]